jgi:hypothetical protein
MVIQKLSRLLDIIVGRIQGHLGGSNAYCLVADLTGQSRQLLETDGRLILDVFELGDSG